MDDWLLWVLAGVALAFGEIATTGFFLAPFALGAFAAALIALVGGGTVAGLAAFLVVASLMFALVRPIARRHLTMPMQIRTGTDRLVGETALVLERIANSEGVGVIRVGGDVWTARAYDEDQVIPAGEKVHVIEIRGATALVSE